MKTLNVMGLDFVYKVALRGYESAVIQRVWNGIGSLTLTINSGITNADRIAINDLLWFDNEYNKAFIVDRIDESLSGNTIYYEITATHINSLLRDFITIPPTGSEFDIRTGTREAVVRAWVDANCINPEDATRVQYPIELGDIKGLGETITEQTNYSVLSDEISRILSPDELSYNVQISVQNQSFIFNVDEGIDRTSLQSENSRILFGLKYGNISEYRKVTDSSAEKNVVYVGGTGTGADRVIVKVDASSGRMKETFLDARNSTTEAELIERGDQAVADKAIVSSYEFEALNKQFRYEEHYDLGDYVTVVIDSDNVQHLQINKIKEIYEKGKIQVIPEFGKTERTITNIISSLNARISNLETN